MRRYRRPSFLASDWIRVRWLRLLGVVLAFVALWPLLRHRPLGPPSSATASNRTPRVVFWIGQAARAACALLGMDWPFDI
jgi:hypothetical protein